MKFEQWMSAEGLSESSIKKYVGAIDGPLTAWAYAYNITSGPIRAILDPGEFSRVSKEIAGTSEYELRNERGHHMYGAALKKYAEFLAFASNSASERALEYGPHDADLHVLQAAEDLHPFIPAEQEDARAKVLREVVQRRGQPKFRSTLIVAYEGRCAITNCSFVPILEAAHITPYLGPATNSPSNGILLRADIHTLWDLGLIAVDPISLKVWVNPGVGDGTYQKLVGVTAFQPQEKAWRPSRNALEQQWDVAQKSEA